MANLTSFFEPRSVALVGASRHKGKVGHEVLVSLIRAGFEGEIYPVNPKVQQLEGLPCYPDLAAIGKRPDLVVIVVPAPIVVDVIRQCGRVGAKSAVVITSGFKEIGEEGSRREGQLVQAARELGVRVLGPNCLGLMVPRHKLNASFGGPVPAPGAIGYFSQSGSLLAAIMDMARERGVGFSKLISIGNKADIDELDVLEALGGDDETRVIAGYLETVGDGDAFLRATERISRGKPILLMKAGQTPTGVRAATSHTGRLAGAMRAYECAFERAGIVRCESITAQFDYARGLVSQPLPAGSGVAVIANAGGPGIMAADAAERRGLQLAELSELTVRRLAEKLPPAANVRNPIDVLGDALADRFELALGLALADPNVHAALILLTPHAMTPCRAAAEAIVRVTAEQAHKPVLACFLGAARVREGREILRRGGIPCYESPEFAVATLKVMGDHARWRRRPRRTVELFDVDREKVRTLIDRNLGHGRREIGEMEAMEVLQAYGFRVPRSLLATSAEQAADAAEGIGYPVVLKIWSPDILHKTQVGGVRTGLSSRQEVMDAFDLMMYRIPKKRPHADIRGVLVQEMCKTGHEVILGMSRSSPYGPGPGGAPLLMFGVGGVLVEKLSDVAFYLAPLTADEARDMLRSTRTYQLLRGDSDEEDAAASIGLDAVAEGLQRLSQLVTEFPQIQELDINPYVVVPGGPAIAVDAHISVEEAPQAASSPGADRGG